MFTVCIKGNPRPHCVGGTPTPTADVYIESDSRSTPTTPEIVRVQDTTTSGDTPWKEFGVFLGPIQKHTGVFHNENGVFIPWTTLCGASQSYLLESCSSLINTDGSLTSAGDKAVGCITNGAIITAAASQFNLPLDTIKGILGGLAEPTGCSGIANMDQIQTSPDLQRLVKFAGTVAH